MKKLVILFAFALAFVTQASAQNALVTDFFDKYSENEDFTTVFVTGRMFGLLADISADDPESQQLMDAAGGLKGLKILQSEKVDGKGLYKDIYGKLSKNGYEDLMVIKEGQGRELKFVIREENKIISELLMISGEEKEFVMIYLYGNIDLDKIAKLTKNMEIDGLDKLQKLDDEGN